MRSLNGLFESSLAADGRLVVAVRDLAANGPGRRPGLCEMTRVVRSNGHARPTRSSLA